MQTKNHKNTIKLIVVRRKHRRMSDPRNCVANLFFDQSTMKHENERVGSVPAAVGKVRDGFTAAGFSARSRVGIAGVVFIPPRGDMTRATRASGRQPIGRWSPHP